MHGQSSVRMGSVVACRGAAAARWWLRGGVPWPLATDTDQRMPSQRAPRRVQWLVRLGMYYVDLFKAHLKAERFLAISK